MLIEAGVTCVIFSPLSVPLSRGDGLGVTGDAPDVVPAGVGLVTSAVDTVGPVLAGAVRLVGT